MRKRKPNTRSIAGKLFGPKTFIGVFIGDFISSIEQ